MIPDLAKPGNVLGLHEFIILEIGLGCDGHSGNRLPENSHELGLALAEYPSVHGPREAFIWYLKQS